jgi:hypothetical protein
LSDGYIPTWALTWSAMRDELRFRVHAASGRASWVDQARLLRVLPCSQGYAWKVQDCYNQRRGANLLLSALDWLMVEMWADARIPITSIKRGIHYMFDRRDRALQFGHREINSLSYCYQAVLRETMLMREAAVGSRSDPWENDYPRRAHTLLLALPPAGKIIFAAMQSERQVDRVAEDFQLGMVFTVYPDAWQKAKALECFDVDLEFLDKDVLDPDSVWRERPGPELAGREGANRKAARQLESVDPETKILFAGSGLAGDHRAATAKSRQPSLGGGS